MKFVILFIAISLLVSCVSYDYYRFEDDKKMILPKYPKRRYNKVKYSRINLLFENHMMTLIDIHVVSQ